MRDSSLCTARLTVRRSRVAAVLSAIVLAVLAPRVYAQVRIAVVDLQRALVETDQGRRAKNQLKSLFQKRQEELDARQEALKRMRDEIEKQKNTLDRASLQRRMEEYQKQFVELQQNFLEYQQELAQREAELTKQILVNLQDVIRQIGRQENYTAIFEQSGVVWSPQHLDLTDRVVQIYNRQYPVRDEPTTQTPSRPDSARTPSDASAPSSRTPPPPSRPLPNPHPRGQE